MRIEIEPGVRLFVDVEGCGWVPEGPELRQKPTLLLVHGGPGFDHSSFKPFFSRFTDLAQIVYFDLRGHGRSDPRPPGEWTLDMFADDIVRLCTALGVDRPWVLGQSFGGFVAQRYLARHPEHADRVVLSSTSHHYALERKVAAFTRLGGAQAGATARAFWERPHAATWADYERDCRGLYNTTPQDADGKSRTRFRPEILFASAGGEQQTMNLRPGLQGAQCPVLVLAGDEDPVCPPEDAAEIAAALPPQLTRFERVPGAGHGVWRDRPDEAERLLRTFFQGA